MLSFGELLSAISPVASCPPALSLAILRRELGNTALTVYLVCVLTVTVLVGWLFDAAVGMAGWNPVEQASQVQELLPHWLEWLALAVLALVAIRPVRRRVMGFY